MAKPVIEIPDDDLMDALMAATTAGDRDRHNEITDEMGRRAKVSMGQPEDRPIIDALIDHARQDGTLIEIEDPGLRPDEGD